MSMRILSILFVAVVALGVALVPDAFAQSSSVGNVGSDTLGAVTDLVEGRWGTLIGLAIALFGLYMWIIKQETWGIIVILGGVAITLFPSIFDGLGSGVKVITDSTTNEQGVAPDANR